LEFDINDNKKYTYFLTDIDGFENIEFVFFLLKDCMNMYKKTKLNFTCKTINIYIKCDQKSCIETQMSIVQMSLVQSKYVSYPKVHRYIFQLKSGR
jgi:hypothetical protein